MKNLKKINLLVTVIGITAFVIGSILQTLNMRPEAEMEMIYSLNQMTYFGAIALGLSIIVWLVFLDHYVFTNWSWWKTKTKGDDVAALVMFIVVVPFFLSLTTFILYDMVSWYNWYTVDNDAPVYNLINVSLRHLENEFTFWIIFVTLISISSGLAIFLYKAKKNHQS